MVEYSEQYPPFLNQPGMASKIRNYYSRVINLFLLFAKLIVLAISLLAFLLMVKYQGHGRKKISFNLKGRSFNFIRRERGE